MSRGWGPGALDGSATGAGDLGQAPATKGSLARTGDPAEAPNGYTVRAKGEYFALPRWWSADVVHVLGTTLALIRDEADQLVEVQPVADFAEGRRHLRKAALSLDPARGRA